MKHTFGFHAILLLFLMSPLAQATTDCTKVTQIPTTECEALIALYNSTNGESWESNDGWLETNTPCSWERVRCSGGHVSALYLTSNQLTGSIPSELGNLNNLEYLHLPLNQLTGSIPSELGNLTKLGVLDLYSNQLTGSIPSQLGNLNKLYYLSLYSNQLTGSIPTELGNLTDLIRLRLDSNQLTGSIPTELGNLRLTWLTLSSNQLTGSIPPELGNLRRLIIFNLSSNQLTGSIPPELGNSSSLLDFDLSSNQLTGSIPTELGNLRWLKKLRLFSNQLTGSIPTELGNLEKLGQLRLDSNQLTGSIPTELGNLEKLRQLRLDSNQLTGPIPDELGNLRYFLRKLWLHNNELCGEIPIELKDLKIPLPGQNGSYLKLDNNHLTAYDAELIAWLDSHNPGWETTQTPCTQVCKLQLSSATYSIAENAGLVTITVTRINRSDGAVSVKYATSDDTATAPDDYTQTTGTLNWADGDTTDKTFTIDIIDDAERESDETLFVSLGNPTGGAELGEPDTAVVTITDTFNCRQATEIPELECEALVALYNSTGGDSWKKNKRWKIKKPCRWYGVTCSDGHVSKLVLSDNWLIGSIPSELGDLTYLTWLDLGNTWNIPGSNQLTGSIPTEFGNLSNLEYLDLSYNELTGSIPTELSNLMYLNLSDNELTGSIPTELGNLTNLTRLELGWNKLTGSIPSELGNLSNLMYLNLSGNELTGSIPSELGNLTNLTELYLNGNQLTGSIPSELGNLTNLTELELRWNQLTGSIPSELGNLTKLERLFLRGNQLTGSIPSELGNLTNLEWLCLCDNQLTGSIPSELVNLTNLNYLWLDDNQLTGSIPSELGNITSYLIGLRLNSNQLCGEIPSELMNLKHLSTLELHNNHLINSDTAYDADFIAWLDQKNPDWRNQVSPAYCNSLLQLSATNYNVNEGDGSAIITVTRSEESQGAVSVDYATSDDSATAGSDYTQTTGTLNWSDGDDADKSFTVDIIDDSEPENNETLFVSLGNPTGGAELGEPDTAEVTITDNDLAFSCKQVTEIPEKECQALIALYGSTDGENWTNNTGWKATKSPCSWNGVSCQGGHVTGLTLGNNNLKGSISKPFFKLKNLKNLVLSDNDLNGTSLKNFKKLKNLETLLLNNCKLSGNIPNSLMKLKKLVDLDLNDNCLETNVSSSLKKWLDGLNPGWDDSQTACFY